MNANFQKLKEHILKHKTVYTIAGTTIVVAGFTYVIMRKHSLLSDENLPYGGHRTVKISPTEDTVSIFKSHINESFNTKIVNVAEREGRGHPGYMVRCLETGIAYLSQKAASIDHNISQTHLCDHLNGKLEHVDGKHFERIFLKD